MFKERITTKNRITGCNYFSLGLYAFAGLGLEAIYAYILEPLLYGSPLQKWTDAQIILHWIVTCITWGTISYLLIRHAKKVMDLYYLMLRKK